MDNYCKQRLAPHIRLQRHLTDIAIRSYLEDYMDEMEAIDGYRELYRSSKFSGHL